MEYIKVSKAAEKWGISARRVRILCAEGKVPGVIRKGNLYMIPENAMKPLDGRKIRAGVISSIEQKRERLNEMHPLTPGEVKRLQEAFMVEFTYNSKAFARFAVIDSRHWISFLLNILPRLDDIDFATLSEVEQRMLQMFYITIWGKTAERWDDDEVLDNIYALSDSRTLMSELIALLQYQYGRIDFIDKPVNLGFECPLDLYCTYTRDQLLVAMDFMKPATVREGVKWLPDQKLDVFFVTLNKADKDYSPTTMYNDYSINERLFHWQSQSTTAENSATGQRYIHHEERGSKVLLFVREFKADSQTNGAAAYTYLGTASYVKHEGSKPMNITWKLDHPIPAKFLKKTNKLVVG